MTIAQWFKTTQIHYPIVLEVGSLTQMSWAKSKMSAELCTSLEAVVENLFLRFFQLLETTPFLHLLNQ